MRLNDPLATSIFFEGEEYPLDLSFNKVLDAFEILSKKDILQVNKIKAVVRILTSSKEEGETFGSVADLSASKKVLLWKKILDEHINLNRNQTVVYDLEGNPMPVLEEKSETVIDLEQDAKYIYASFRQIGINLYEEQNKLQWSEFQSLLEALPDNTIMQRIIQIRLWTPQKGESAKYKEQMRRLQDKYRLDVEEVGEDD